MQNAVYLGLQGLALALIFAPEPFTTVPGIWLLAYARAKASGQKETVPRKRENTFAHLYDHRLQKVGESAVIYELHNKRSGQLPHSWPVTTKMYKVPQSWKAYNSSGNRGYARPHLINGVQLHYGKVQRDSGPKMPNKFHSLSGVQPAKTNAPLAELYQAHKLWKQEQVRNSKSFSLLQREHIAKMLESMRYAQSFAAANARRKST